MSKESLYRDVESSDLHDLHIYHLGLSWPVFDCLQKAGFHTVGQLAELSVEHIARISGLTLDMHLEISDRFFSPIFESLGESDSPLSGIELAAPVEDALIQSGIKTLGALGLMSYLEILTRPDVDMSSVAQIKRPLEELSLSEEPSIAPIKVRPLRAEHREGSDGNDGGRDQDIHDPAQNEKQSVIGEEPQLRRLLETDEEYEPEEARFNATLPRLPDSSDGEAIAIGRHRRPARAGMAANAARPSP